MTRITFNFETHTAGDQHVSGLVGTMSWDRLLKALRQTGEVRPHEKVTHIEVTEDGLRYRLETEEIKI